MVLIGGIRSYKWAMGKFKCFHQISRNHLNEGIENDYTWYNIHISRVVLDVFSLSTGMDLFQVTDF